MKEITLYTLARHTEVSTTAAMMTRAGHRKETVKIFTGRPTPNQLAVALEIPMTTQESMGHGLRQLANGGHLHYGDGHTYYALEAEEYRQAKGPEPKLEPAAWEAAFRTEKLKNIDLAVKLQKLQSNWDMFSGALIKVFED